MSIQAAYLPDGRRLHLHHGPIDLIVDAEGPDRADALQAAMHRFKTVLPGLVRDLPALRQPVGKTHLRDSISQRMAQAVAPHTKVFVTPMAAVAGAVADDVLSHMVRDRNLSKAYVNNGGDIAFHLAGDQTMVVASADGPITIHAADAPRGVATSGWRGRSQSRGIADAVTVLAQSAAAADVAATLIANAVDLPGHPAIKRERANRMDPDSDLEDRLVTTDVGPLSRNDAKKALNHGATFARACMTANLIHAAILTVQGESSVAYSKQKDLIHA